MPLSPTHCLKNILKCRSNGYSLRWRYLLTVFRFQTRYVKDSLKYRGAVLWNTICYYEQEVGRSSLNNLKKKINTYSPETTLRNSNLTYFPLLLLAYTYRLFCYLEVITYVIFYFQIQVIFTQRLYRLFFYLEVITYIIFYFQIQVIFTKRLIFLFSSHDPTSM